MSQRKARLRRKAQTRSRSNTERLKKKGKRMTANEREAQAEQALAEARREHDKALTEANATFGKGLLNLQNERTDARKTALARYEERRAAILKDAAAEEQAA